MKGEDVHLIGIGSDKGNQPSSHIDRTRLGKRKAKDITGIRIRFQQNLANPGSQDLGFPRTRAGNDHDRPLDTVYRFLLLGIQGLILLVKNFFLIHNQV